jgi:hypothetical protein
VVTSPLIMSSASSDQRTTSPITPLACIIAPTVARPHPGKTVAGLARSLRCYSARSTSAGLSRAVARPGQNATALAMTILPGAEGVSGARYGATCPAVVPQAPLGRLSGFGGTCSSGTRLFVLPGRGLPHVIPGVTVAEAFWSPPSG